MTKPRKASNATVVVKPQDWDKALAVAYLRMTGATQRQAARVADVGYRTICRWEASPWWQQACDQARPRWMRALVDGCKATVFKKAVGDQDAELALKLLERMDPEFAERPTEINFRGLLGVVQTLPADEIARLQALPPDQRRAHLQLLASGSAA